jgi:hypothetical protein
VPENDFMHQTDASGCPTDIYRRLVPGGDIADGHCGLTWTPPSSVAHLTVVGLSKGTKLGKLNRFLPENNHLFNPGCFFDIFIVIELTDCISHTVYYGRLYSLPHRSYLLTGQVRYRYVHACTPKVSLVDSSTVSVVAIVSRSTTNKE